MSTLSQTLVRRGFQIGTAKIFHSLVFVKLIEYTKRNVRRGDTVNTPVRTITSSGGLRIALKGLNPSVKIIPATK